MNASELFKAFALGSVAYDIDQLRVDLGRDKVRE